MPSLLPGLWFRALESFADLNLLNSSSPVPERGEPFAMMLLAEVDQPGVPFMIPARDTPFRNQLTMSFEQFLAVVRTFEHEGVEYILVGGVAVNIHGIVRTTEDIDFFVRPTPANVERIRAALRSLWSDPHIEEITAEDLAGAYPTIRYGPPAGDITIDLMAGLGTAWRFDDLESERRDFGGTSVRVATPTTLFKMKRSTVRPRDHADALLLRERFKLEEEQD